MNRLLCLLMVLLGLAGCRSTGPTVNPFLGNPTVPAQPTGAIGTGANTAPYYPPNIQQGQPTTVPPAGPYGQQQWQPSTGSLNNASVGQPYAAAPANFRVSGDVVNLDVPVTSPGMYDPNVQQASAQFASGGQSLSISAPVTYPNSNESALRVPTDSAPLVTQRQVSPPAVTQAPVQTQPAANPTQPVVYNIQQGYTQTILPPSQSGAPLAVWSNDAGQTSVMPAKNVYGGAQPIPVTVTQQEIRPQVYLQPRPQVQPIAAATPAAYNASGPTLAYGPTPATFPTQVIRQMPAVEITDLPPAKSQGQSVAN